MHQQLLAQSFRFYLWPKLGHYCRWIAIKERTPPPNNIGFIDLAHTDYISLLPVAQIVIFSKGFKANTRLFFFYIFNRNNIKLGIDLLLYFVL
jgi:hypothetical protein